MNVYSWKKKALTTAILGMTLGLAVPTPGLAADAGGFDDVPRDNWSYGAVQTLLKDGIIDNFDDNTFNGQKIVTRFEMAQIIRRATNKAVNSTTISEQDKAIIIKLSQEYKKELSQLKSGSLSSGDDQKGGAMVRPGKNGIIDFSGTKAYIRYDYWQNHASKTDTTAKDKGRNNYFMDVELRGRYEFAPKWNARFMLEMQRSMEGYSIQKDGEGDLKEFSFDGPIKVGALRNSKIAVGRFKYKPNLGYVTKAYTQGGLLTFDATKKLKVEAYYGTLSNMYYRAGKYSVDDGYINNDSSQSVLYAPYSQRMAVLSGRYQWDRKTRLYGGFYFLTSSRNAYKDARIWELAGQHDFDKTWTGYFDWARSNRSTDNSLYYAGLRYKKADREKPHSWEWMVQYAFHEAKSTINSDLDIKNYGTNFSKSSTDYIDSFNGDTGDWYLDYNNSRGAYNGAKGYSIAYKWVPLKHSTLLLRWMTFKPIHYTKSSGKAFSYRNNFRVEYAVYF